MNDTIIKLAHYLHSVWKEEKERNGFHLPVKCPNFEHIYNEDLDTVDEGLIHCNKCNTNMGDFESLEEFVKKSYYEKAANMYEGMTEFGLNIK